MSQFCYLVAYANYNIGSDPILNSTCIKYHGHRETNITYLQYTLTVQLAPLLTQFKIDIQSFIWLAAPPTYLSIRSFGWGVVLPILRHSLSQNCRCRTCYRTGHTFAVLFPSIGTPPPHSLLILSLRYTISFCYAPSQRRKIGNSSCTSFLQHLCLIQKILARSLAEHIHRFLIQLECPKHCHNCHTHTFSAHLKPLFALFA